MVLRELYFVYTYDGTEEESADGWWGEEEEVMTLSVVRLKCCVQCGQNAAIRVMPNALDKRT
jgi:hypothetical protein